MANDAPNPRTPGSNLQVQFPVPNGVDDEIETLSVVAQALDWKLRDNKPARVRILSYLLDRAKQP